MQKDLKNRHHYLTSWHNIWQIAIKLSETRLSNHVNLSENYVDLSENYVDLSDNYVDLSEVNDNYEGNNAKKIRY